MSTQPEPETSVREVSGKTFQENCVLLILPPTPEFVA